MKTNKTAVALLVGAFALTGCAGTPTGESQGSAGSGNLSAAPGFDPDEGVIRVGAIMPFSGPVAPGGEGMMLGLQLYADRVNSEGGVAGKYKLEIVPGDSAYDPQQGLAEYNRMAEDVVMIGGVLGTGVVHALLPQAASDEMLIVPGSDTSDWLRQPNVLPTRPTYEVIYANGLTYAVEHSPSKNPVVCSLVADDSFGESVKHGVDHTVEQAGMNFATEVSFPVSTSNFTPQISELKSGDCDVVAFGASSGSAQPAMAAASQLDFAPMWVTHEGAFAQNLLDSPLIDYLSQTWIVSSPGVEWGDASVEGMTQLVEDFEEYAPADAVIQPMLNTAGYTYGMALHQVLERAVEEGDLSHASILKISQSDRTVDFKGLAPELQLGSVEDRQAPATSNIFSISPEFTGGFKLLEQGYESDAAKSFSVD